MNTPVAIIIYNRPDYTIKLINKINKFKIKKIYIIADGPKKNNKYDLGLVNQTRKLINNKLKINKKIKIYSNKNLGCRRRVITGLDKVFKIEKKLIILEDDCIPSKKFFNFTEKMLILHYKNKKISSILGTNHLTKWKSKSNYIFSRNFHPWGWATWNDRWLKKKMDPSFLLIFKSIKFLSKYLGSIRAAIFWSIKIFIIKIKKKDVWDYSWCYYNFLKKNIHIAPYFNLIDNIGVGKNFTNTKELPYEYISYTKLVKFKKKYKNLNKLNKSNFDDAIEDIIYSKNIKNRIRWLFFKIGFKSKIKLL